MSSMMYSISAAIRFPEGLLPGAGRISNRILVSRNGNNKPVLRGTAIAGVLRHRYEDYLRANGKDVKIADFWFGEALEDELENDTRSALGVDDAVLSTGTAAVTHRMHNAINRHTGAPIHGGLFSIESLPPGSGTILHMTLCGERENEEDCRQFISVIAGCLESDLVFGGCGNRGIGRAVVEGDVCVNRFDLSSTAEMTRWLDYQYQNRSSRVTVQGDKVTGASMESQLNICVVLSVPRGEDLVIGDQCGQRFDLEPQQVRHVDGSQRFRLPGSSLRGVFRSWFHRLAAREGATIRDSFERFDNKETRGKADDLGWGFVPEDERAVYQQNPAALEDPVLSLFGSLYSAGRIHIADSFSESEVTEDCVQVRKHVAVDRFYGGAREGALFENSVLASSKLRFPVHITIRSPLEPEVKWLSKTLLAVHMGILAFGSSKASGRLAIQNVSATGPWSDEIRSLKTRIAELEV